MAAYKATGYGNNSTARNVLRVYFSQALSSLVKYEAYDNDQGFPALDVSNTNTTNHILAGTSGNSNKSMVCLVDTTKAAPSSAWKPASATGGAANPNRLKGTTNYVIQAGGDVAYIRGAGEAITFNMVIEIPSDATTEMAFGFDLLIRYTYTVSPAPALTWGVNTGSEGSPSWQATAPGTYGWLHCRSGSGPSGQGGDGKYYANIPASSTEDTAELWADTSTTPS